MDLKTLKRHAFDSKTEEEREKEKNKPFLDPQDGVDGWKFNQSKSYFFSTLKQFDNNEIKYRSKRITASNMAKALGLSVYCTRDEFIQELLGLKRRYVSPEAVVRMTRGTKMEPRIRQIYEEQSGNKVQEVGLVIPSWCTRIGASLDGIIVEGEGKGGSIEIKCPSTGDIYPKLSQMLIDGRENFEEHYHDHIQIEYYIQCQAGMAITKRPFCDFIVYGFKTGRLYVERVWFNEEYWNKTIYPGLLECINLIDNYNLDYN